MYEDNDVVIIMTDEDEEFYKDLLMEQREQM